MPDELPLGLEVSHNGQLVDAAGVASDLLYTVGPPGKGQLWETHGGAFEEPSVLDFRRLSFDNARLLPW